MPSTCLQQRRRGSSFREHYCDAIRDWSNEETISNGDGCASADPIRRSPSLSQFGKTLLPPQSEQDAAKGRLTVVFDLDETLIYGRKGPLYVRPGVEMLFALLKQRNAEVVVWTSSIHKYADAVVSQIDSTDCIAHVIYRHQSWFKNVISQSSGKEMNSLKNLNLLGRKLENVIIFENTPDCLMGFEQNGILVEDYDGGELEDLTLFAAEKLLDELLCRREAALASGEEPVSVQDFIKSSSRLQLEQLPTDKGSMTNCYCLASHERDDSFVPFSALSSAQKRSKPMFLADTPRDYRSVPGGVKGRLAAQSPHPMRKENTVAKRRYEAQKIASH